MSLSTGLAVWGAVLSTTLAVVKLWELWRDGFRIELGYRFAGLPDIGNTISIHNLSGRPLTLTYWELLDGSGRWPWRRFGPFESAGGDWSSTKIEAHSTCELSFVEERYFNWNGQGHNGHKLYIKLWFAGRRRPVLRLVYSGLDK
jgi:hypothetical protein